MVAGQAVDIQLKILQTLLSILTYCKDMHGDALGTALLLCFKLQDSRVSVVSSTAAATLRQAIMVVFDRVTSDANAEKTEKVVLATEPPEEIAITPAAMDAYLILWDLCLLTTSSPASSGLSLWSPAEKEKPRLLKLSSLQRTFGLELIESILSGYDGVVKKHPELLFLLRHDLHPLVLRLQAEKPSFPVALRICRIIYVLIRHYADQLPSECETYLLSLIRMGTGDAEDDKKEAKKDPKKDLVAPWQHVLSLEVLRGISGDPALLRAIWTQYDKAEGTPDLFAKLVSAFGRLVNDKPQLLGVSSQIHGLGVPQSAAAEHANAGYLDMGIGMMASAASAGVSTVTAMIGPTGGGLGQHSTMKQRLIEQHDKAEAPPVPETYPYLLAVQSLDAIAESIPNGVAQADTRDTACGMAESAWPALLAALSYLMSTELSDQLFAEVLTALQDFTIACGELGLSTPRDAFINTLARYAVPPPVVSAMQSYFENGPQQKSGGTADALGLAALGVGGGPASPPSLSERNLACLRSLVGVAQTLASSLGPGWHDVLETLQNANYLLSMARKPNARRTTSGQPPPTPPPGSGRSSQDGNTVRPEALQDLDTETIQAAVTALFERSRELDDEAFTIFITALCKLSSEMIGMNPVVDLTKSPTTPAGLLSPGADSGRRRTSGINISQSIKSGERSFGLSKLRAVAVLNLPRLIASDPSVGWTEVTQHLLKVARHVSAPSAIRLQASETLSELLLTALRTVPEPRVQHQVFDVLVLQVDVNPVSNTVATDYEVRSSGFATLNQILESSGHSLEVGWPTIFGMLDSVCKKPEVNEGGRHVPHRGDANLVRIAFPSLTLICTDFLSSLDATAMRQCIACLGFFGKQQEDVNITLAAIGLLWNVSDKVQGESKELWLYLLTELLELARDSRLEVRTGAMQTLFRCVELYGADLSSEMWDDVLWKVVFPLLETMRSDESQVLALTSVGSIFGTFGPKIASLPSNSKVFETLFERLKLSFISEPRQCSTASLKVLERVVAATEKGAPQLDHTWNTFSSMGAALSDGEPYTQDNLVALVRVAALLHDRLEWTDDRGKQLSSILRAVIAYSRSPDYRPDVDSMSPLQEAVAELVAKSTHFGASLVLSDLAEFSSLAYVGDGTGKLSYVALSKFAMPKMADVYERTADRDALYDDGTIESVIGAYALPIKLKYDCPSANKWGSDPPLWRTAMTTFVRVLKVLTSNLEGKRLETLEKQRFEAIWGQVMDVFAGVLLADDGGDSADPEDEAFVLPILEQLQAAVGPRLADPRIPDRVVSAYAETLRKASVLYHYDVRAPGGTTAPVVAEPQEKTRYWAFDHLIASSSQRGNNDKRVTSLFVPSLLRRLEATLRHFLSDAKLRGQMPFSRVREEEILYVLRHLVTMTLWEGSVPIPDGDGESPTALAKASAASSRAHLFAYYPLLLELAFVPAHLPAMWILPSEHVRLFAGVEPRVNGERGEGEDSEDGEEDARDGTDLIEVSARDLARRCLELVGLELGLSSARAARV
ncbi:Protein MON2 [Vanrija pseudolonga]|uniref:Protein MON2 n=1 Tax=Vanrija pseudolonga TaxID=143232 RepID=A0AAF1BJV2_9TREE|nr:Protein MON2 [Vanrija pseudolonga]